MERDDVSKALLEQLTRVGEALEDVSGLMEAFLESQKPTVFPFHECSIRVQNMLRWQTECRSCEDLIEFGRSEIMRLKDLGDTRVEKEIDPIMDRLGFQDEWLKS